MPTDPLLVVAAHDAGGAEVVSSWLRRFYYPFPGLEGRVLFHTTGPAKDVFARKFSLANPDGDPTRARLVVCGSSSESWVERDAIEWARRNAIPSVVWLDHWTRYRERFVRGGSKILPDEVWTCDEHACRLASAALPDVPVLLRGNPYLAEILGEIRSIEARVGDQEESETHAACVSRPERVLVVYSRGEESSLVRERVLENLGNRWPDPFSYERRLRPHPADRAPERSLAEDVAWADTVVGWDSMALVVALEAGRRVFSVLPPEERTIPYAGIERL